MSNEIQAAHIAAQAAICSAWIQGLLTFAAGSFAIFAGYLAYRGALRQVKLEEDRHTARVAAYRFRIIALTDELERLAGGCLNLATMTVENFHKYGSSSPLAFTRLSPVPDLSGAHWESHALLGQSAVRAIHTVNSRLCRYMSFQQDAVQERLTSGSVSKHSRPNPPTEQEDGSLELTYTLAAEVNETLSRELVDSIKELKFIISAKK